MLSSKRKLREACFLHSHRVETVPAQVDALKNQNSRRILFSSVAQFILHNTQIASKATEGESKRIPIQ